MWRGLKVKKSGENAKPAKKGRSHGAKVIIKYDVGFSNNLFIRGSGAGLSWDKGQAMRNVAADEWVWEPSQDFDNCEFKVLLNDQVYETGENHHLSYEGSVQYTPHFN